MAKVIRGGKIRDWNPHKHPRGKGGRFVETPDTPSTTGGRSPLTRADIIKQSMTLKATKKAAEVYQARLEFIQSLNLEQRRRFQQVLEKKKSKPTPSPQPEPVAIPTATKSPKTPKAPKSTTNQPISPNQPREPFTKKTDKKIIKKYAREGDLSLLTPKELDLISSIRAPVPRVPGDDEDIKIADTGKITIWDGRKSSKYSKFDPSFKVRTNKSHKYQVTSEDGTDLVLNRHPKVLTYKGEKVDGVPSLHPKLAEMSDKALIRALVDTKGFVEASEAPPAPQWKPLYHGSIPKQYVADRGYGGMEIHHIDQWAKTRFDKVTGDYNNGLITLDEAKDQMRSLLRPNPKEKSGYEIDIKDQDDRKFVVLAAGTHNFTSPLYFQNHPMGLHPDTGSFVQFGIPKNGSGGRGEFNKWRDGFWREVYRKESYALLGELNRRVSKGKLSRDDARKILSEAHQQATKDLNGVLSYRKQIETRNAEIKTAKEAAGLTKRTSNITTTVS